MLNADLCLSQWSEYFNEGDEGGVHGPDPNNPLRPADPSVCAVRPRLITLNPGQHIYRWIDAAKSGTTLEEKATGRWWSTKRGAMRILLDSRASNASSTTDAAREYSAVKDSWSNLDQVICALVVEPIRCYFGVGRDVTNDDGTELDSRGLQLFIPNLAEKCADGVYRMTEEAKRHLRIKWLKSADAFGLEDWNENMPAASRISL